MSQTKKIGYLIPDRIGEGQFRDEYAISFTNYRGHKTSGFFPVNKVKDSNLKVEILKEADNIFMVRVPGRFIEGCEEAGQGCFINVNKDQVCLN